MNIFKFDDFDFCSIGIINVFVNDLFYEEVVFMDIWEWYYKKCIIYNDLLVGVILMGDKVEFVEYRNLIENCIELLDKWNELFRV